MTTVSLSNGKEMPLIGLGTWKSKPGEVEEAVKCAVDVGYRLIDCAYCYGNEAEVGAGLASVFSEGKSSREDLFIVGKLWNTRHSPADVKPSVQESLGLLGLSYFDLYLIHWPHAFKPGKENFPRDEEGNLQYVDIHYLDTWKALEQCVDDGLIRSLGLSNFNSIQIQDIMDNSRIKPVNLQVEIHPYFSQEKLVRFTQERGLSVTAYSPLGSADRPWASADDPKLIEDPKIKEVATKYKKSPAQVILRWLLHRGISVIPKSVTPSRIRDNLQLLDFTLDQEDIDIINSFNKNTRLICPMVQKDGKSVPRDGAAPYYPFQDHIEF